MKEGAAEFWAAAMFGGPATDSGTERIPYNPDILKGMFDNGRVEGAA